MSSSTESKSKDKEKKGDSENNPKDEMPKETSTVESNSKGARPKTSSTLQKSKKQTEEEKQFLKVLIMNAKGPSQGEGTAPRRKQTIQNVINRHNPDLVLFQEFSWKGIHGNTWSTDPVPEHYQLTGSGEARIMYYINELTVTESPKVNPQKILEELKIRTSISQDFTPIPRMALRVVKTKGVPFMEFICISWHGNHAGISNHTKITEFKYLMIFLNEIYAKINLPLLIAGDFNVDMKLICHEVKEPFKLYEYEASERRKTNGVIDYFIASKELHLSDMTPVDLKKDSKAKDPEEVLDHDPIIAILKPAPPSDTAPPLDEVTVTNGEIDDLIAYKELHLSSMTPVDIKKDLKADKPEEVLDHDLLIAEIEPAPWSDTAPALDKDTVKISKKAK